jgi:hypothetical protein
VATQLRRASLVPAARAVERQVTVLRPSMERLLTKVRHRSRSGVGYHHVALAFTVPGIGAVIAMVMANSLALRWSATLAAFVMLSAAVAALFAHLLLWAHQRRSPETQAALRPSGGPDDSMRKALVVAAVGIGGVSLGVLGTLAMLIRPVADYLHRMRLPEPIAIPQSSGERAPRADQALRRDGYVRVAGGIFYVPPSFESEDGAFDLFLHFHGNTEIVKESVAASKLNAVVYIENLGVGSGAYEDKYAAPGAFDRTLASVEAAAEKRGLRGARARRVALSSWSAGYGALSKILDVKKQRERVDAVLVLDGIHAAFTDPRRREIDRLRIEPFLRFSEEAAHGVKLLSITHSDIDTVEYASTTETANALLREVDAQREPSDPELTSPPDVNLQAAVGVVAKSSKQLLKQTSEARLGQLHVRGYVGKTAEHHMAHLLQMSTTVLPELVARWSAAPPSR